MDQIITIVTVTRGPDEKPAVATPGTVFVARDQAEYKRLIELGAVAVATDEQIAVAKAKGLYVVAEEAAPTPPVKATKAAKAAEPVADQPAKAAEPVADQPANGLNL